MKNYKKEIFAVVILFHPTQEFIDNLILTLNQVDKVIAVVNGSSSDMFEKLNRLSQKYKNIVVIENKVNLGIDGGTDIGINYCKKEYKFVLTLDQDSIIGKNMVDTMIDFYYTNNKKHHIGELSPATSNYGNEIETNGEYAIVDLVNASGRIIPIDIINKIGFQSLEGWFVDGFDWDFTLRMKSEGYKTIQVNNAKMYHQLGANLEKNFFGKKITVFNHSALRKYYITRNYLYMNKKYLFSYPKIIFWMNKQYLKIVFSILFIEPDKLNKIKYSIFGIIDFFKNKKQNYKSEN
jgi:rhamnosyltransferase